MKSSITFAIVATAALINAPALFSQSYVPVLVNTFTNPTPVTNDNFGLFISSVGPDRVLIGAPLDDTGATDAGAAYLFSTNGSLLTTFTNPTPAIGDSFGSAVANIGGSWILIGGGGAAYMFSTNGLLVTTFDNPTPAAGEGFGISVKPVGEDRVLVGSHTDKVGALFAGAAYLFHTNGTMLTTFTNPTPASFDFFGEMTATVGSDLVLISARLDDFGVTDSGVAYLFNTNGSLLVTFTNPTPAMGAGFGVSVAALGSDRVLIGAQNDNTGAPAAGIAHLFSTNGLLLTTFTNPFPASGDQFGTSVAATTDLVVIGALADDTGTTNAGSIYVFSTNGVLLTTITNPAPDVGDLFGVPVRMLDEHRLLTGAYRDDIGATNSGIAYLYDLKLVEAFALRIQLTVNNTVGVSWPSVAADYTLQQNTNGLGSLNWSNASGPFLDDGTNKTYIVNPPTGEQYFRLFKP